VKDISELVENEKKAYKDLVDDYEDNYKYNYIDIFS